MSHYKTLGIGRDATGPEVKKAYRVMAHKHHPDKNPNDEGAAARFSEVLVAYGVLSDPARRKDYDTPFELDLFSVFAEVFKE